MASTKEMQARAKARKMVEKMRQGKAVKIGQGPDGDVYATGLMADMPKLSLHKTEAVKKTTSFGFMSNILPEGLQSYKTEICNVAVIRRGDELPCDTWMTGYGISYMTKVQTGTPRAYEFQINLFADGDESGDMLQMFGTAWDDTNDKTTTEFNERELTAKVIHSLPDNYKKLFVGKYLKVQSGKARTSVGWVSDDPKANADALAKWMA